MHLEMHALQKGPYFWLEEETHLLLNIQRLEYQQGLGWEKILQHNIFKKVVEEMKEAVFTQFHNKVRKILLWSK